MSNGKFFSALAIVGLLFLAVIGGGCGGGSAQERSIVILYTNDVHCGVDENIGYAGLAFYKHEMEKSTPYVTLVDAGDAVQGGIIGAISNGRYIIEIMNAVSYDFAVPGNHEFDYGMSQFEDFAKTLTCGYVSCNFRNTVTGQIVFEPYRMFKYGNTKVAFVGACTPATITTSTPSSFMNDVGEYIYDFDGDKTGEKLCASIQKAVDAARDEGANFVILVGHLGENVGAIEAWSVPYLIQRLHGIDAVIDGHSHEVTPSLKLRDRDGQEVTVTQTGTKLKYIGKMTIKPSGEITTELIDSVSGRDEKVSALIAELKNRYEDTLKTKLGRVDFDMLALDEKNAWLLRNSETNLCNFATDAILAAAKEKEEKADLALINAGGIRANLKAGELTYGDVLTAFPFGNTLCICDVPGQTILDELELGVALMPGDFGGLLHVAGLSYSVDVTVKTPVQVDGNYRLVGVSDDPRRVKDARVGGEPLDSKKTYSVIASSYVLREGGDGHRFEGAKMTTSDFITVADALAHYIKSFGGAVPEKYRNSEGRMYKSDSGD